MKRRSSESSPARRLSDGKPAGLLIGPEAAILALFEAAAEGHSPDVGNGRAGRRRRAA